MHRIDGDGHVDGLFSLGNEEQGILATEMTADWPNAVQEELCAVIEAQSMALDKADNQQLLKAIQAMVAKIAVPAGTVIWSAGNAAPSGYLPCDGRLISRVVYAGLFASIGTTFGDGDGGTTFKVPDLRGEFIRGWDNGRGVDSDRVFGSSQCDALKSHTHTLPTRNAEGDGSSLEPAPSPQTGTIDTSAAGDGETRPRNIALLACIKY